MYRPCLHCEGKKYDENYCPGICTYGEARKYIDGLEGKDEASQKRKRERLIALIEESTGCTYGGSFGDVVVENEIDIDDKEIAQIADYLLANGVMVEG